MFLVAFAVQNSIQKAKMLNDTNFEHDTQATTGSTTGDWILLFCNDDKSIQCSNEVKSKWDELAGVLRGRASVAYIDIKKARETQIRFNVEHNRLPAIFFIRKGKYYRYNVEMVHLVPQLDIEAIEKFIVEKEYEDIPNVFPEDYGEIPK